MLGEVDTLEFVLAQDLGKGLGEVRAMPNAELVEWRAYYRFRHVMDDLASRSRGR